MPSELTSKPKYSPVGGNHGKDGPGEGPDESPVGGEPAVGHGAIGPEAEA